MLAKRERLLLGVLIAVVATTVCGIVVALGTERLSAAQERAFRYEEQIKKLSQSLPAESDVNAQRDTLRAALETGKKRFYAAGEMNPYVFGTLVKKSLAAHDITVVRYQVVEQKGANSLEFSVSGNVRSFVMFLKEVSESPKYWTISSLTLNMREGTSTFTAAFRIGYETLDSQSG